MWFGVVATRRHRGDDGEGVEMAVGREVVRPDVKEVDRTRDGRLLVKVLDVVVEVLKDWGKEERARGDLFSVSTHCVEKEKERVCVCSVCVCVEGEVNLRGTPECTSWST